MYEPLILEKKKPRSISGTPAAKVSVILNLSKIFISIGGLLLLSNHIMKRKKFIAELDEIELSAKGSNKLRDELQETKDYWKSPSFQGIVSVVLQRHWQEEKLAENSLNTMSTDIQNK